jgi:uncharacterized membrane protein YphA (DoxX/SURF4 family)
MYTALSILLAAACLLPGLAKVLGHPKMQKSAAHFGIPWRRYRLIGVAELAAAVGVLAGLWWHPSASPRPPGWLCCSPVP